jgi:hypothetical protein
MSFLTRLKSRRLARAAIAAGALVGWACLSTGLAQPAPAKKGEQADPAAELYALGFKFQGAGSCGAAACHGAPIAPPASGAAKQYPDPSFSFWNAPDKPDAPGDPHRKSFKTLGNAESLAIGKKLGIANPKADAQCIACHSLNVPAAVKGPDFSVAEGVTCNACHGPSGPSVANAANKGWNTAHQAKDWAKKQRAAFAGKHGELLKTTGFYDTHQLVERSHQCVSCHLAMSPKLTAAGHPQPTFEMNWYSVTYPSRHWVDPTDNYFSAKLWACGQAAALKAALHQLGERADPAAGATAADLRTAYLQAYSHYQVFAPLFGAGGLQTPAWAIVTKELTTASQSVKDPAKRPQLAAAAEAAAAASAQLAPLVDKWQPDKAMTMKLVAANLNASMAGLGGAGIEQQRSAVFALYSAFAGSADKTPDAEANVNLIGEKLFPVDDKGAPLNAFKVPAAGHTAAIAELKGKIK